MASNSKDTVQSETLPADRTSQIHEKPVTALPSPQQPEPSPASPTQEHPRANTPTPQSSIPENVLKLREEYRRSSAESSPKATTGFVDRVKSLKKRVLGKFKPKTVRVAKVPRGEGVEDGGIGDLPDTVTQRRSSRLLRSKTPGVYVSCGSAGDLYASTIERPPTPFTPTDSPSRSLKGDKSLPPIPEAHGSPISFNTLANFDDPFVRTSTPEHDRPYRDRETARDSKFPDAFHQQHPSHIDITATATAQNNKLLSFLLSQTHDEEQDAIHKAIYQRRRRDALDARIQALKYQVTTLRNQIAALEEQVEASEAEAGVLGEELEYEEGVEERGRGRRGVLEGMVVRGWDGEGC
ncbi:hypothetical protein EG327_005179 [Venturia inaequalis]|uniref:Uncharacterized protein n=1 Tax=Venturia inaequalis TaxID=5025 RepID=A0A8H3VV10_VENIN|nr:hypothetical protein EG327_005179 [Venturia inaequalis]